MNETNQFILNHFEGIVLYYPYAMFYYDIFHWIMRILLDYIKFYLIYVEYSLALILILIIF